MFKFWLKLQILVKYGKLFFTLPGRSCLFAITSKVAPSSRSSWSNYKNNLKKKCAKLACKNFIKWFLTSELHIILKVIFDLQNALAFETIVRAKLFFKTALKIRFNCLISIIDTHKLVIFEFRNSKVVLKKIIASWKSLERNFLNSFKMIKIHPLYKGTIFLTRNFLTNFFNTKFF